MRTTSKGPALRWTARAGSALTVAVSLALTSGAWAQSGSESAIEEIAVTGSRIQRTGMSTPTPVTTMEVDQLTAMAPGNLIEAFDQIPQFLNNESPKTQGNYAGAGGASHLNLRGIGVNR